MDILYSIRDPLLFRPFLADADDSIKSWRNWMVALRVIFGLPIKPKHHDLIRECTGRTPELLPRDGFTSSLLLTGRRSGKSRLSSVAAAGLAILGDPTRNLAKGEQGVILVCAPTREQSKIVKGYLRSIFSSSAFLADQVVKETRDAFDLSNGVRIAILSGDHRVIRGFTLLAVVVDEIAFMGTDESAKTKSDSELVRALEPALATTQGKFLGITTPYARRGYCWTTYQQCFGNDNAQTLVWNAPSRVMNPTLSQAVIDKAYAEDLQSAKSEYGGEFRDLVSAFISSETINRVVVKGRRELLPDTGHKYSAYVDLAAGSSMHGDDAALAICHPEEDRVVLDLVKRYTPPFSPYDVIRRMAEELRKYNLTRVTGDLFAPGFVGRCFTGHRINYVKAMKNKSDTYSEVLPRLTSGHLVELLDDPVLVSQLCSLERRVRSGGREIIDHPRSGRDDVANAVCGAILQAAQKPIIVGALGAGSDRTADQIQQRRVMLAAATNPNFNYDEPNFW